MAKEICKNCANAHPTYKGIVCGEKQKKVKATYTCEYWRRKA